MYLRVMGFNSLAHVATRSHALQLARTRSNSFQLFKRENSSQTKGQLTREPRKYSTIIMRAAFWIWLLQVGKYSVS